MCEPVKSFHLDENVKEWQLGETKKWVNTMETVVQKLDSENTLENKNVEMANLQDHVKDLQNRLDKGMGMQC